MRAIRNNGKEPPELKRLRELSARLGSDRLLVQASSGNTSIKVNGTLWIKASGKWLVDAEAADFLIPVQLARARTCLNARIPIPETNLPGEASASIETAMHAALPHKVIVHVHSVNAIAWAIREDAPGLLSSRLCGLDWEWIPYTRSGAPLAEKIADAFLRSPRTNVFVLGNHGLVICGETCDSAEHLLWDVETRLKVDARPAFGCRLSPQEASRVLASDPLSRKILSGGVLYPCQAFFLPWTVCVPDESPVKQLAAFQQPRTPLLIEDSHELGSSEMTAAEEETLLGLANVVQRIHPSAAVRYLSFSEVEELFEAHSYNYAMVATRNGPFTKIPKNPVAP